jgi:hypothetical protein
METETEFSWLQKRHWKVVGSFSDCATGQHTTQAMGRWTLTFLGPWGFFADLRLPYALLGFMRARLGAGPYHGATCTKGVGVQVK